MEWGWLYSLSFVIEFDIALALEILILLSGADFCKSEGLSFLDCVEVDRKMKKLLGKI